MVFSKNHNVHFVLGLLLYHFEPINDV